MTEFEETVQLANRLLDEPYADPDDGLRMLSRQFLRQVEAVSKLKENLVKQLDPMGDLIQANRDEILKKHEEAVTLISSVFRGGRGQTAESKLGYILKVLEALNTFHPMHAETWCGWPREDEV